VSCQVLLDPTTDRVVATREVIREVRVKTLHAAPGTAHSAARPRADVIGRERGIAFAGVPCVRGTEIVGSDSSLRRADTSGRPSRRRARRSTRRSG